eukprot:TRINITY_DN13929_c0_g1_i2.p1 TRINITY_DN13929_c0_g1~~TRINITY_DN13929_c0_g1_i2.p1  ORF type:complete len:397 (-),score=59.23 TRINITY_DN13929_c0_g1_i2:4-1116(-)
MTRIWSAPDKAAKEEAHTEQQQSRQQSTTLRTASLKGSEWAPRWEPAAAGAAQSSAALLRVPPLAAQSPETSLLVVCCRGMLSAFEVRSPNAEVVEEARRGSMRRQSCPPAVRRSESCTSEGSSAPFGRSLTSPLDAAPVRLRELSASVACTTEADANESEEVATPSAPVVTGIMAAAAAMASSQRSPQPSQSVAWSPSLAGALSGKRASTARGSSAASPSATPGSSTAQARKQASQAQAPAPAPAQASPKSQASAKAQAQSQMYDHSKPGQQWPPWTDTSRSSRLTWKPKTKSAEASSWREATSWRSSYEYEKESENEVYSGESSWHGCGGRSQLARAAGAHGRGCTGAGAVVSERRGRFRMGRSGPRT